MKIKILLVSVVALLVCAAAFCFNVVVGIVLTIITGCLLFCCLLFVVCNKLIRHTNWWNNQYVGIKQFVSNAGYRDNIIRNYDIVNLGSNPARFAFFYEDVKGQSWATGSQGQDMDLEILKYYHSYIKEGGTVLIPIMPFTAISPYLKNRSEYWGVQYYSKFAQILDSSQVAKLPYAKDVNRYLQYPLLYDKYSILSLVLDSEADKRYEISEQKMMSMELLQDASNWIKMWLKEFQLRNLNDVTSKKWEPYYREAIEINKKIVDFCLERSLKPVFICVPMTKYLSAMFPESFVKYMITDFVAASNIHNITFLDYTEDERFQDETLFIDSYFLNLKGRKQFTKQVIADLGL